MTHDISTGVTSAPFVLHSDQADDHNLPAFLVRPDHRILAVYSKHGSDKYVRYRITTNPNDTSAWDTEQSYYHEPDNVTYSNVFRLSAESGRIYNFFRGTNYNPTFIYSGDDGETWTYDSGPFIRKDDERPYVKYASNNVDTLYFVTSEAHPQEYVGTGIYAGYFQNGHIYKSDGTDLGIGPVAPESLTPIYTGDPNHEAWTVDIHLDSNGNPYIAYTVQYNADSNDNRYRYARWDGTQWQDHSLAYAGTCLYKGEEFYTGLAALDPQNPDRIFISTDADPDSGDPLISSADGQRHYELFEGMMTDDGATWAWQPITQNSVVDNLRPIVPIWDSTQSVLLWMRGTYTSYTNYDLDIVGMFDPEPINPTAPWITSSPDDVQAEAGHIDGVD